MVTPPETNGQKPLTCPSSTNYGDGGTWEDQDEDGQTKNILSFKNPFDTGFLLNETLFVYQHINKTSIERKLQIHLPT
jgi:hypothetical protein